ncbi:MAG: hypothetical protein GF334_08405, partial [Candidatus Altiarchaeales archaeon]|nr:hypothetical protein [Candidatus Altiarchaeales archaeon]
MTRKLMILCLILCLSHSVFAQPPLKTFACEKNTDCGSTGYGSRFCLEGDVYEKVMWWVCVDPGENTSRCEYRTQNKLVESCSKKKTCLMGECRGLNKTSQTKTSEDGRRHLNPVVADIKSNPALNARVSETLLGNLSLGEEDKTYRVFVKLRENKNQAGLPT